MSSLSSLLSPILTNRKESSKENDALFSILLRVEELSETVV